MTKLSRISRTLIYLGTLLVPSLTAFAAEGGGTHSGSAGLIAIAAGIGIGIAAFGGALGQSKASSTALDGIARNPEASGKIFTPFILGLAMIESLVLYALIVALMLIGKI